MGFLQATLQPFSVRVRATPRWAILLWVLAAALHATNGLASAPVHSGDTRTPRPWTTTTNTDLRALLLDPSNHWSPNTTIHFPEDRDSFDKVTERWSTYAPPTYSAAISPATEKDVAKAVWLARRSNVPFLATGGRHGLAISLAKLKNGLAIDLGGLNSVNVDRTAGTVTVGGGVRMGDVLDPVAAAGFELQTGSCSCPGLLGATIGAGVGRWQGLYGLMLDALVSVRLVTADGRLLDQVSQTSNSDLFWGMRGAGSNLGIITSATYKLHKTDTTSDGDQVINTDLIFAAEQVPAYFKALETFNSKGVPPRLAGITIVLWNETAGTPYILANWVLRGTNTTEANELLAPFLEVKPPVVVTSVIPWNKVLAAQGFGIDAQLCVPGQIRDNYGVSVRNYSASALQASFDKMTMFFRNNPGGRGSALQFETFSNEAANAVPKDATAYPWRDTTGNFLFLFSWADGDNQTAAASASMGRELRDSFVPEGGYSGKLAVYINNAKGDEPLEAIYGHDRERLSRLARLKRTWDAGNALGFNYPLPLFYY